MGSMEGRPRTLMLAPETGFLSRRIAQEAATLRRIGATVDVFPALDDLAGAGPIAPGATLLRRTAPLASTDGLARRGKAYLRRVARPVHRIVDAIQYAVIDRAEQIADANETELMALGPYDLIVAHDLPVLPLGLRLKRAWNVPLVVDLHEIFPEQADVLGSKQAQRYWRRVEAVGLPQVDGIVTVNEAIDDYVRERYAVTSNRAAVHNAVPYRQPSPRPGLPTLHQVYGLPPETRVAVFAGSLRLHGNLETMVEGFGASDLDGWVLALVGDGPARQSLERLVAANGLHDRVRIGFRAAQNELVDIISSADFGVIPFLPYSLNLEISTPAKLYEYIQARLPILTTRLPLVANVIEEHQNGAFLDAATVVTTAAGYREFVRDGLPRIDSRILEAAAAAVSWGAEEKALLDVFDRATGARWGLAASKTRA